MSAFSVVTISIVILLVIIRYSRKGLSWVSTFCRSQFPKHDGIKSPEVKKMVPYPAQPIPGRERYRIMMNIRKLDVQNWLTLDKNYMAEHRVRDHLLREKRDKVLRCLPESIDACQEALGEVSKFLCQRFPNVFHKVTEGEKEWVENLMTKEKFDIDSCGDSSIENNTEALEAAVRLTMEDLSILLKNDEGEYYLAASASLFPTGWTVEERIGWSISRLHNPVPLWHQQVGSSVCKFLSRLTPTSPMERSNYFIEVKKPNEDLFDILYRPGALCEKELCKLSPNEIIIRRERQTFRRLPRTGALLFAVKTYLTPIEELPMQELENLAKEMKSWPDYVSEYKGKDVGSQGAGVLQQAR
ncbi:hypothetical protein N7495_006600 [Penicillium taxi]|uniref:uncharacterized protein n=1 Tax=Penicillium taxi TaxID=168475 RepID=UPI0025451EC3|nr:uncharacterized protein N7495_006600 [Penicillium taxi]KAJ5894909.1 hypothetical protein N7495_006600 [Penicillium taxi]